MSITGAAGGDVTQFDHFTFRHVPTNDLHEEVLVLEAQETRDIVSIHLSGRLFAYDGSMPAEEHFHYEGRITMALGQEEPRSQPNDYRSVTRMPVVHNFSHMGSAATNGEPRNWTGFGFEGVTYLGDPAVSFLWQQGETLFVKFSVQDQGDDEVQAVAVQFDGVVAYTPA